MLIEFTGPSASGKSAFARYLLREWSEVRAIRRTLTPSGMRRPWGLLADSASFAHKFPIAFKSSRKWYREAWGDRQPRVHWSFRLAAEHCVLQAASNDSCLWLLDQGRLQLGSWLDQQNVSIASTYAAQFQQFITIGRGVLSISMDPQLAVSRVYLRGDGERAEAVAKSRGFASYLDLMKAEKEQVQEKIKLAQELGSHIVHVEIREDASISECTEYLLGSVKEADQVARLLLKIADQYQKWWNPSQLAKPET